MEVKIIMKKNIAVEMEITIFLMEQKEKQQQVAANIILNILIIVIVVELLKKMNLKQNLILKQVIVLSLYQSVLAMDAVILIVAMNWTSLCIKPFMNHTINLIKNSVVSMKLGTQSFTIGGIVPNILLWMLIPIDLLSQPSNI